MGCGNSDTEPVARGDGVVDLADEQPLRTQFERDAGKARLLVVLSPT